MILGHLHGTSMVPCVDPNCWAVRAPPAAERVLLVDPDDRSELVACRQLLVAPDRQRSYLVWSLLQ